MTNIPASFNAEHSRFGGKYGYQPLFVLNMVGRQRQNFAHVNIGWSTDETALTVHTFM
jgi:hypothetical protein